MSYDPIHEALAPIDPELAAEITASLTEGGAMVSSEFVRMLIDETIWGMSQEAAFGRALARGMVELIDAAAPQKLLIYRDHLRRAALQGPTLGGIMAVHLVPVLRHGGRRLLKSFVDTLAIMRGKGEYTLIQPLHRLSALLKAGELEAGSAFIGLLGDIFAQDLSYRQCQHLTYMLPKAVGGFPPAKRAQLTEELRRVARSDPGLIEAVIEGLKNGLTLLSPKLLADFISAGLERCKQNRTHATKFLALESKYGLDTFQGLQVAVPITQVQSALSRYLRARTGLAVTVRPISCLPMSFLRNCPEAPLVCSDGKSIYLQDEIDIHPHKVQNIAAYKLLASLEAGFFEYGSFDFDLERARQKYPELPASDEMPGENCADLERLFRLFPVAALAADLYSIFELGRIGMMLARHYPGLTERAMPAIFTETARILRKAETDKALLGLYAQVVLGPRIADRFEIPTKSAPRIKAVAGAFEQGIARDNSPEVCAGLVAASYPGMEEMLKLADGPNKNPADFYRPLEMPHGRSVYPELFFEAHYRYEKLAWKIKNELQACGLHVYRADLRKRLAENNGTLALAEIKTLISTSPDPKGAAPLDRRQTDAALNSLDLSVLPGNKAKITPLIETAAGPVFWHKEWDYRMGDYLHDHVRVIHKTLSGKNSDFYRTALSRHRGLVRKVRRAFECLKPEGIQLLRQWLEGDAFDYRALLEFAVDKKTGFLPSDRLYIKRIKQNRSVAVLLLVDLSRSTANRVSQTKASVLDVAKEAVVLFCEALGVVGDRFAIAGFSGSGRLGLDYYAIKDFDENMNEAVRQRISALAPQRNTRMGGAIRHAAGQLAKLPSKVKLLIIVSDGYPNDLEYKQAYAVADTRRAILEARSLGIYAHAIAIAPAEGSKLNDLYGDMHYNLLSDVRDLPDKLLRIYTDLTR